MAMSECDTSRTLQIVSTSALDGWMRQIYQDEHALLVPLLSRLLLMVVDSGQSLVDGCHGDVRGVVDVLAMSVARTEKVREQLMPRSLA
jgi:hypothetical protein